jgi:hypothetical protein
MIAKGACTTTAQDLAHLAVHSPPRMNMTRTPWALNLKDFSYTFFWILADITLFVSR